MQFDVNVGKKDQMIRIDVGALLFLMALVGVIGSWGYVLGIIGIATGFLRFCPGYKVMKMDTLEKT
jgi:hypothetical protein